MDVQCGCIPVAKIDSHPMFQLRQDDTVAAAGRLEHLAASLAGPEGLIHPIVVMRLHAPTVFGKAYVLITGARRLAAARQLGWATIRAHIHPPGDLEVPATRLRFLAMALREDLEREALTPLERREALLRLKALYETVHPPALSSRTGGDALPFIRWAAASFSVPDHVLWRDLRLAALTPVAAMSVPPPAVEAPMPMQLQYVAMTSQTLTTTLQTLVPVLTQAATDPTLGATLQTLRATMTDLCALWQRLEGQLPTTDAERVP